MVVRRINILNNLRNLLSFVFVLSLGSCGTADIDYIFQITGKVVTSDEKPLQDVDVVLKIEKPVYDEITPVNIAEIKTNENGEFAFSYIADSSNISFEISFTKEGFETILLQDSSENTVPLNIKMNTNK